MTRQPRASSPTARLVHMAVRAKLAAYGYSCEDDAILADRSLICVGNHACSLDSWIAYDVTARMLRRRFLHLGETAVIARFPILRRFGVLPVSATDPMLTMRSLTTVARAARTDPCVAVWIFPTGDHIPSGGTVGAMRPGLHALTRLAGDALVVPVGIHYYVYQRPRISAWVHLGSPLGSARDIAHMNWQVVASDMSVALTNALKAAPARVLAHAQERKDSYKQF